MQSIPKNTERTRKAGGAGPRKLWAGERKGQLCAVPSVLCSLHCPPCSSPCRRLDQQKNLVELSFLPGDTGKPDVFAASLGRPPLKRKGGQIVAEERDHKGEAEKEQKKEKRKEKSNQKAQEEVQRPSQEKKERQTPPTERQAKQPRPGSGSGQVGARRGRPSLTGQAERAAASPSLGL